MTRRLALACALLLGAGLAAAAEPLGRMFFTPAQRASLDVARSQKSRVTLSAEKSEEAAPVPEVVTYSGMVRRGDGKTTVWINSRAMHDNERPDGATMVGRVKPDGGVTLQNPQTGRSVDLKPGQSIELLSGAIEEGGSRRLTAPSKPEAKPKPEPKPVADAKGAKPSPGDSAKIERDREDQERQLNEAARTVRDAAAGKPGATPQPAAGAGTTPSTN